MKTTSSFDKIDHNDPDFDWDQYEYDHLTPEQKKQVDEDEEERYMEAKENELAERAATCDCGAWQFNKERTKVIHVADCCCGAE